jgi:hypothetical protein
MHRINGVVDKPSMLEGPRFDVTRKGNRVPTSFSMSNTVHDNNDVRAAGRTHRTKPDVN